MQNMSDISGFVQSLAILIRQFPELQLMADVTIKSVVLLTMFLIVDSIAGRKINNTCRHLIWLNSLLCLVLLPFLPIMTALWTTLFPGGADTGMPSSWFELPVYASETPASFLIDWGLVVVFIYLVPVVTLLGRTVLALHGLKKLRNQSQLVTDHQLLTQLAVLQRRLGISRNVALRISTTIESPVSWGLLKPHIMLPAGASEWSESTMTDVLLHELCHIKRLDWLTTVLALVVASVFWVNPLVWFAVKRLREESENSCDTAVLNSGRNDTDYAESLLSIAASCIHARRQGPRDKQNNRSNRSSHPLVQTMLDQNTLKTRISRVLEENKMSASELKKQVRKSVAVLLVLSAGALGVLGSQQVLYAQQQPDPAQRTIDEEMFPLNTIVPVYPRSAAEASIEGWAQVRFTVSADGTVAENSVSIVDAEPADIFNNSAIDAARQFRFSPRIVAGEPVDVSNVQYVFRFYLSAESERAALQSR